MVHFMREAKRVYDFPSKEASGREKERAKERESNREREREIHVLELHAQDNFFPLFSH
jgi:hypothetical protein